MAKMKAIIFLLTVIFMIDYAYGVMSEAQIKATLKMIRNVCQPKSKVTDEQITAMHNGDWNQDKNAQCYYYCILTMYKLLGKDNSFDWQAGIKTIEASVPAKIGKPAAKSMENCKDSVKTPSDKCMAAFEIATCIYKDNPGSFFLP